MPELLASNVGRTINSWERDTGSQRCVDYLEQMEHVKRKVATQTVRTPLCVVKLY